jgi:hypothetical protein
LQDLVGGADAFEPFMRDYLTKFAFKTVSSDQFKQHLLNFFKDKPAGLSTVFPCQPVHSTGSSTTALHLGEYPRHGCLVDMCCCFPFQHIERVQTAPWMFSD